MRYFIPSWNGDFRFEPAEKNGKGSSLSDLVIVKPTFGERDAISRWAKKALKKGWITKAAANKFIESTTFSKLITDSPEGVVRQVVEASIADAAGLMAGILNYKRAGVLTALKFESGKVYTTEIIEPEKLPKWIKATEAVAAKTEGKPEVAVTVKRPSLSCPECSGKSEADRMPCDALWEFLDADQRAEWLATRSFTSFGSKTGHAYNVAPRDSKLAKRRGRPAFDLDDRVVIHNYDLSVPPEEEALQVKLILEHREQWIRIAGEVDPINRATPGTVFQNPFLGLAREIPGTPNFTGGVDL